MKFLTIMDVETTGTDPTKDRVVEIGAVLWSIDHASVMAAFSTVIAGEGNAAEAVNAIPSAMVPHGTSADRAWKMISGWADKSVAICGHNVHDFDRLFVPAGWDAGKPWLCTMTDIEWPKASGSNSLVSIALAHGLGVVQTHRALTDCMLVARLFERCRELGSDVPAMIERGLRPAAVFQVAATGFDEKRNALAKEHGFSFHGATKTWRRRIAIDDALMFPFAVREVTEYELTDVAREALRVPSRATSDAPAERFEPLEALRRIAAWCAERGTSHESCDEALDSIYAIACTSRSIADRSTD